MVLSMNSKQTVTFKTGDPVSFDANGYYTWIAHKQAVIAAVVPAGSRPDKEAFPVLERAHEADSLRDHDSYVVHVPSMKKWYWPQVAVLRPSTRG